MSDVVIPSTNCPACQTPVIPASVSRQPARIKLNGTGGQWPAATINPGDVISMAFRKNGGAWAALSDTYTVSVAPSSGRRLIGSVTFRLSEEPVNGDN
jgi:hypothetical protein